MPKQTYAALTDDQLIERGAALETERAKIRTAQATLSKATSGSRLLKPAVKLVINATLLAAGFALAPVTFNLSFGLTIIAIGMTLWDGTDLARDAASPFRAIRQNRRLRRRARQIDAALREIDAILTARLGPP